MKCVSSFFLFLLPVFFVAAALSGCTDRRVPAAALLNDAVEAAHAGQWETTFKNAAAVLKREPDNADALVVYAVAAEKLGRDELALDSARRAAERHSDHYAAQYTLGRMLSVRPGAAAEAVRPLERALKIRPRDVNTLLLLGACRSRINADNAIDCYLLLPPDVQARPEVQNQIAIYYLARRAADPRNFDRALQAWGKAYRAAPKNPELVWNLALLFDHYTADKNKTYHFYAYYLDLTKNNPELNAERALARSRMRELKP